MNRIENDPGKLAVPSLPAATAKPPGAASGMRPIPRKEAEFRAVQPEFRSLAPSAKQPGLSPAAPAKEPPAANASAAERAGLLAASREFEALFLRYLAGAMRETIPKGGLGGMPGAHFYGGMIDEQFGRLLAENGRGLQLAEKLSRQVASLPKEEKDGSP